MLEGAWIALGGDATLLDPAPFLVALDGGRGRVEVIGPPGSAGDRAPRWLRTTTLGADRPRFG